MKSRLILVFLVFVSIHANCWAKTNISPCDPEAVTIQHKASFKRMRHASKILFNANYGFNRNAADISHATDELDESLTFLQDRYHPTSKWSPDIPKRLLQQLQAHIKNYKLKLPSGKTVTSTSEGISLLKQELNGPQRKTAIAVLNVFTLYSLSQYNEALINLKYIQNIQGTKACLDFKKDIKDKKKAYADSFQGRIESFFMNTIGVWLLGGVLGFFFFKKSGRPGWMICIPFCLWGSYCVVSFIAWIVPLSNQIANVLGLVVLITLSFLWHKYFGSFGMKSEAIFGSAAWASIKEAQKRGRLLPKGFVLKDSHGFTLGRLPKTSNKDDGRLRYMGHVLTCAPTGAGKGIGAVIPNLLEYPGSALVLDVKGENYAITHKQRQNLGHQVFLIDPFGITGAPGHSFNFLDGLKPDHPNVVSESLMLADMLVIPGGGDSYWDEAAKDLLRGLLIYVAGLPEERRHLGELRRLLTSGEDHLNQTLDAMRQSQEGFGVVERTANAFLSKADKDRSGVLSSAIRHTSFLDDPRIIEAFRRSDFTLEALKTTPMTVYIAIPPTKISTYNRFMRCFVGMALAAITENTIKPAFKVAFFLDEFAQLGRMSAIEDAISVVRGYGAVFWIFIQDLSQLKGVYPKWQTFLANAGAKQFFGTSDLDTARYISSTLGQETLSYSTQSHTVQDTKFFGSSTTSQQLAGRSLLTPDEVLLMGARNPIVLISGESPYLLHRLNYLEDREYEGLYDKNPYHS